jgi:LacI family transcriptional regulator
VITSKEIAEICKISRGTVDRALNNRPGINAKTKEYILKVAEEMGYKPNLVAQSLVKGRTMTIGVVVLDLNNRFFSQLLISIERKAKESNYFVYFTVANSDSEEEINCINHLVSRQVDGIILYSVNQGKDFLNFLDKINTPLISVCNYISDDVPFIGIDDQQAIKEACKTILDKGYTSIVYVGLALKQHHITALEDRLMGFRKAMQEMKFHGEIMVSTDITKETDLSGLLTNKKTAFLCCNDEVALKLLNVLNHKGIQVPQEVGIMGFDEIDVLDFVRPQLATVNYPIEEVGRQAVDTLIKIISKEDVPQKLILDHKVVNGESLQ